MPRYTLVQLANMCRQAGGCTEGMIAYWTGLSPMAAYRCWKHLRQLCEDGLLDTEDAKCEVSGDRIVFRARRKKK